MRGSGYGLGRYLVTHASASFSVFALSHLAWHAKRTAACGDEGYETYEALARTPVGPPLGTFGQVRESEPEAFNKV